MALPQSMKLGDRPPDLVNAIMLAAITRDTVTRFRYPKDVACCGCDQSKSMTFLVVLGLSASLVSPPHVEASNGWSQNAGRQFCTVQKLQR
jgi:hypothetical protein